MNTVTTRILLVEDDEIDAHLVKRALRRSKIRNELIWVNTLAEGLRHLEANDVSLVITDLGLPDCCGLEAVKRIRAASQEATIIVLSGLEDSQTRLQALDHGAQDYLIKHEISPFTLERAIEHGTHRLHSERKVRRLLHAVRAQKSKLERQAKLLDQRNRRLSRLCKTAQQFVNNVSHDFRTPLTIVKEYASLIADGVAGEVQPEQIGMLRVMGDRVDDLNNMVDDMLDVSRHNSGLLGANREPCRLQDVVQRLVPGLHEKANLRGITLQIEDFADLPKVFCDGEKVGRVIVNLITNAIKFTDSGGTVIVKGIASPSDGEVRVAITDDGQGISEKDCRAIFTRFRQANSSLQNTSKGFGLGLSIAKELVDLNLGKMSLESMLGEGSTFSFTVPIDDPCQVANRYLERLSSLSRGKARVSLLHATIESTSAKEIREARCFLTLIHRSRDLIIDVGPGEWLVLICGKSDRISSFLARAEQERHDLNRNRPSGPLPVVDFQTLGTYRTATEADELLRLIADRQVASNEASCV